jgi:hypothetical protein
MGGAGRCGVVGIVTGRANTLQRKGRIMSEEESTSLSGLDDGEWQQLANTWARGWDWYVGKVGRMWEITLPHPAFKAFPLFKTKTAASDAASKLILMESRYRAMRRARGEG